jgi:hypothetical protein
LSQIAKHEKIPPNRKDHHYSFTCAARFRLIDAHRITIIYLPSQGMANHGRYPSKVFATKVLREKGGTV